MPACHVVVCNILVSCWASARPDRLRTHVIFVYANLKRTWHGPDTILPCPTHTGGTQNPAKVVGYILLYTLLVEASLNPNRPLAHMPKKGFVSENLLAFYAPSSPVLAHWLPHRRLELNPKAGSNTDSTNRTTSSGRQAHSAGCGCSACRG